jgi:hypothetical protein
MQFLHADYRQPAPERAAHEAPGSKVQSAPPPAF